MSTMESWEGQLLRLVDNVKRGAKKEARADLLVEVLAIIDAEKADIAYNNPVAIKHNAGTMRRVERIRDAVAALSPTQEAQ